MFSITDGIVTAYADKSDDEIEEQPSTGLQAAQTMAGKVLLDFGNDPTNDKIEFKNLGFKPKEWAKVLGFFNARKTVTVTDSRGRTWSNCTLEITKVTYPRRFTRITASITLHRTNQVITIGGFI